VIATPTPREPALSGSICFLASGLCRDSSASLRCVNPTLNIHPDAASSFLKPGHLADDGNSLAIRAMPNHARGRAWEIA
jgi:hypothetical protein